MHGLYSVEAGREEREHRRTKEDEPTLGKKEMVEVAEETAKTEKTKETQCSQNPPSRQGFPQLARASNPNYP
jgi:hypothetical protein